MTEGCLLELTCHQLDQGLNLYLYETDKFSTVTAKAFIQTDLTEKTVSANALIPMILRRGTKQYATSLELAQKMESLYGSALGTDILKIGERQILEFYFDMVAPELIPQGRKVLTEGFNTFGQFITEPIVSKGGFYEKYFNQEQLKLGKMVDGLINDKRAYAISRAINEMCGDEPFGLYKYGQHSEIDQLDNQAVYKHYCDLIASNPIDIFVVGSNLADLPQQIKSWNWQRREVKSLSTVTTKKVDKPREVHEQRAVQQSILVMGYRTYQNYLSANYYALIVANGILGIFPHSKLFINVREQAGLAYYVGSSLEGSKGLLTITAGISSQAYSQAVDIINEQVAKLQQGDISDDELSKTKIGLISGVRQMVDIPTSIIDRNLIGLIHNKLRSPEYVMAKIAEVTKEQVQAAAQIQLDTIYFLSGPGGEENAAD